MSAVKLKANGWRTGTPRASGVYLVTTVSEVVCEAYCDALTGKWSTDDFEDVEIEPVIAWQPLPAPYKPTRTRARRS